MIKNTLPDKSGNPESLKKIIPTVRKLLRFADGVLHVVLFSNFVIQVISKKKKTSSKGFTSNLRDIFTWKES